ncbi:MAG: N-6 DNA methylase [Candidatus Hodarchaeales archaeon]|jgi:type I restriction enzyme M protein
MEVFKQQQWQIPKYFKEKVVGPDGKYINPIMEPLRQWMISQLIQEFKIPLSQINLVFYHKTSKEITNEQNNKNCLEINVMDDRFDTDVEFILVKIIAPFHDIKSSYWKDQYNRLRSQVFESISITYAIITNGKIIKCFRRQLEGKLLLEEIKNIPKYETYQDASRYRKFKVNYSKNMNNEMNSTLKPLDRSEFRRILGDTRGGIHAILRANEGFNPQEAVEEITKIFLTKYFDEFDSIQLAKKRKENIAYIFSIGPRSDPERLLNQVKMTFEMAKRWEKNLHDKNRELRYVNQVFDSETQISLNPTTLMQITERLQQFSLHKSSPATKGAVFEDYLGTTFRDDLGQYFTPSVIIDFMIRITDPQTTDIVGDPACGPARFQTHVLSYIKNKKRLDDQNDVGFVNFRDNNLFGADNSGNILQIAKLNCLLNDAPFVNLTKIDSLAQMKYFIKNKKEKKGFIPEGLTLILTNPPFGLIIDDKKKLRDFTIINEIRGRIDSHLLFIERCLEFLEDGGILGIVIPESILDNKSNARVRQWIYKRTSFLAVISLPLETFKPYGTGIKAAIMFLQKLSKKEIVLKNKDDSVSPWKEKKIFMAFISNVGYNNTGRPVEGTDIDEIINAYIKFKEVGELKLEKSKYFIINEKQLNNNRFDVKYHEPYEIDNIRFPVVCSLLEYCNVIEELTNLRKKFLGEKVPFISIDRLENDPYYIEEPEKKNTNEISSAKMFQGGDVIFARLGPSISNKKSFVLNPELNLCYGSSEFLVLRPKAEVPAFFLLWLLKSKIFIEQALTKSTGATPSRLRLHKEFLKEINVPKFTKTKQIEIATNYFNGRKLVEKKFEEIKNMHQQISPDF